MIDIAHAKQEFEKYLDEYDREDEQICLKIVHTYGVMKYAGEIARKMECSGEDVELAELMIGRKGESMVQAAPRTPPQDRVAMSIRDLHVDMPGEVMDKEIIE